MYITPVMQKPWPTEKDHRWSAVRKNETNELTVDLLYSEYFVSIKGEVETDSDDGASTFQLLAFITKPTLPKNAKGLIPDGEI